MIKTALRICKLSGMLLLLLLVSIPAYSQAPFITKWKIKNNNETIVLPTTGTGYAYTVNWGDGTEDLNVYTGASNHTYASSGEYYISITGALPKINFSSSNHADKLLSIEQWGDIAWSSMSYAFSSCPNLVCNATDAPDLSNVTDLSGMFYLSTSFNGDLSNWDVSNVTDMNYMFAIASSFNGDISTWDVSHVTNMNGMFVGATNFNGDISNWNVGSVTDMSYMFQQAQSFNGAIGNWDVSQVTSTAFMFYNATSFNQDLNNWNVGKVFSMNYMFSQAKAFNGAIGNWDVSHVIEMGDMFNGASAFNQDLSSWDMSNVTATFGMFGGASAFNQDISAWDVSNVTEMAGMFFAASSFNQPIGNWNVSKVMYWYNTFTDATSFNQDLSGWDVSQAKNMNHMFQGATSFNQNLSAWNVSNVTTMSNMFNGATAFDADLSGWDLTSVTDMSDMFRNATGFNNQSLSGWDVSNVTNMSGMFFGAASFDQDLSAWNVGQVRNMTSMFQNASSFNQDLSAWDVSQVSYMTGMFNDATAFNQNLGNWDISSADSMGDMLSGSALSKENYEKTLLGWATLDADETAINQENQLGAAGLVYCNAEGHSILAETYGWTFTGDDQNCPPVLDLMTLEDLTSECEVAEPTAPTATDDKDGVISGVTETQFPIVTKGTTVITWTFTDNEGNVTTQTQNVIIADVTAPVAAEISLPDITAECSVTDLTAPVANDNCSGVITGITETTFPIVEQGTTVVTWTFTDESGNTSSQSQSVVIADVSAPVADMEMLHEIVETGSVTSLTAPTATDNCSGIITATTSTTLPITESTLITWHYTDAAGNELTQTQQVTVMQNQTITFGSLTDKTYGDAGFELTASASSGLEVTYTSSDTEVATISGKTLTIVGAGTTTITASQAGNETYYPASGVTQTLTVNQAALSVKADDVTITYGEQIPALSITYTGFVGGETATDLQVQPVAATLASNASNAGTYTITVGGAADRNYAFNYTNGTLTINKASQQISFDALAAKTFGDASFQLSASASSSLAVTFSSSNENIATINGSTVTIIGAGTTTITASQSGNINYLAAATEQTLSVAKAAQTITFEAIADVDLALTSAVNLSSVSSAGLEITYTLVTGNGSISGNTLTLNSIGTYTVKAAQAGNGNYNAADDVTQSFTVTDSRKSDQTITFETLANRTYGDANFNLAATASSGLTVSYTSSNTNVATVSGSTVTIIGVGETTITASQEGDASHHAATSQTQVLTVNKAVLTATADNLAIVVGDAIPALTITYTGFVNGENAGVIDTQPAISTTATSTSGAGTYAITLAGGSDDHYTFTLVNGTLIIIPEQVTLGAEGGNKLELYPNPATAYIQLKSAVNEHFTIYDQSGRKVGEGVTNGQISVQGLPSGIYLVRIGHTVLKLIKD